MKTLGIKMLAAGTVFSIFLSLFYPASSIAQSNYQQNSAYSSSSNSSNRSTSDANQQDFKSSRVNDAYSNRSAQGSRSQQNQNEERAREQRFNTQDRDSIRTIEGEIIDTRTVNLKQRSSEQESEHVIAKIQISNGRQNGRNVFVDLGPRNDLRQKGVSVISGDKIKVSGASGRINDRPVLVAIVFSSGGRAVLTQAHRNMALDTMQGNANQEGQSGQARARFGTEQHTDTQGNKSSKGSCRCNKDSRD